MPPDPANLSAPANCRLNALRPSPTLFFATCWKIRRVYVLLILSHVQGSLAALVNARNGLGTPIFQRFPGELAMRWQISDIAIGRKCWLARIGMIASGLAAYMVVKYCVLFRHKECPTALRESFERWTVLLLTQALPLHLIYMGSDTIALYIVREMSGYRFSCWPKKISNAISPLEIDYLCVFLLSASQQNKSNAINLVTRNFNAL